MHDDRTELRGGFAHARKIIGNEGRCHLAALARADATDLLAVDDEVEQSQASCDCAIDRSPKMGVLRQSRGSSQPTRDGARRRPGRWHPADVRRLRQACRQAPAALRPLLQRSPSLRLQKTRAMSQCRSCRLQHGDRPARLGYARPPATPFAKIHERAGSDGCRHQNDHEQRDGGDHPKIAPCRCRAPRAPATLQRSGLLEPASVTSSAPLPTAPP